MTLKEKLRNHAARTHGAPEVLNQVAKDGANVDPEVFNDKGLESKPPPAVFPSVNGNSTRPSGGKKLCILSLDGGGMRGLIAARILCRLEALLQEKTQQKVRLCDCFDLIAGTSTGAIIGLMLATPDESGEPLFTPQGCCQFYALNGRMIFKKRWYDPFWGSIRQMYRPKYSPRKLEHLLEEYLVRNGRALTLVDTMKPVLLTAFDISQATPFFFARQAALKNESRNFRLFDVCRAVVAAPTYFRPAHVTSVDKKVSVTLIDGAVVQNNPALVAVTHAWSNNTDFPEAAGLQDVLLLSLGAGQLDERYELNTARKWGLAGWMRPLLSIMMDGNADTVDYQLSSAFAGYECPENYLRIQVSGLPKKMTYMDCASEANVQQLTTLTDELLTQKAVARDAFGDKVVLDETYEERLSWFADQLIAQKNWDAGAGGRGGDNYVAAEPTGAKNKLRRLVSPVFGHLLQHHRKVSQ